MRVLIDSHVFLWWVMEAPQLTPLMRDVISDGANEILFSAASAYELAYKADDGRLTLPEAASTYILDRMDANGFDPLPVDLGHALTAAALPRIHRDPFDRLLIAQAQREGIPIVTSDPLIGRYDVDTLG